MERTFFFGALPSKYSGSAWGFNADSILAKLFFWVGKDLPKLRLIFRPQKGVWGMNAGGIRIRQFFFAPDSLYLNLWKIIRQKLIDFWKVSF